MASIFHYTNAVGLLGILENECLFASDYRYLNDSSEGQVIRDLLLPVFQSEVATITPELIKRGWLKKEFYDEHGIAGHRIEAESLYKSISKATDNISPFFVLSFCRHDEKSAAYKHGLLSQWRAYSQGGGFAIEFDEGALDELMRIEQKKFCYAGFKSADVVYEKFEEVFDAKKFKGVAGTMLQQVFLERQIDIGGITGKVDLDKAVLEYAQLAPFLKHAGFKEEAEYRMVGICLRESKIPSGEPRPAKPLKCRHRNNFLIPYIELFETHGPLPIKSIIVGPSANQQMQADAAQRMAEVEGFKVDVRLSDIPYRS